MPRKFTPTQLSALRIMYLHQSALNAQGNKWNYAVHNGAYELFDFDIRKLQPLVDSNILRHVKEYYCDKYELTDFGIQECQPLFGDRKFPDSFTLRVEVTKDDIQHGCGNAQSCPIALAMKRQYPHHPLIGVGNTIDINVNGYRMEALVPPGLPFQILCDVMYLNFKKRSKPCVFKAVFEAPDKIAKRQQKYHAKFEQQHAATEALSKAGMW